jgi:DNA-binding winged helix-turn-helix (wHTH) protein
MPRSSEERLVFGEFWLRVDVYPPKLYRSGHLIHLDPRAVDVLSQLVQKATDTVLSKDLFRTVWGAKGAEPSNLHQAIRRLRMALADSARKPQFIETIHGDGYKFLPPVEIVTLNAVDNLQVDERIQGVVSNLNHSSSDHENLIEKEPTPRYPLTRVTEAIPDTPMQPDTQVSKSKLQDDVMRRIAEIPRHLPDEARAISWIIGNEAVEAWKRNVSELVTKGIRMSRPSMMASNEALLQISKTVAVVEAKCYNHATQWSDYWKRWLRALKTRTEITRREYYVLVNPLEFTDQHADNLLATEGFLTSVDFGLSVCSTECLRDFLGEELPQFDTLNIFGRFILQVDIPLEAPNSDLAFAGGHKMRVWFHDTEKEPVYATVCKVIRDNADRVTPSLVKTLLQGCKRPLEARPIQGSLS